MKTHRPLRYLNPLTLTLIGLLVLGWAAEAPAQYLRGYTLGTTTTPLVTPEEAVDLNSVLPEPEGGFVAVWDTAISAIVQRRDRDGVLLWSWVPPQPLPVPSELTRAVYGTRTHTLWCSVKRWYLLENETGTPAREGTWTLPYLDPSTIIIHDEELHVSYQGSSLIYNPSTGQVEPITYSSVYDTNMVWQTVMTNTTAAGFWHSFGGAWLLDFGQRTNKVLRLCTISPGFVMSTPFTVSLPAPSSGGYASQLGFVDHKVLSADTNAITVLSTVHWPSLAETRHYFTTVDRDRNVIARHTFNLNQIVTGVAPTPTGWIVSAQSFNEATPRHTLYKVDSYGRPFWQTIIDTGGPFSYRVLNVWPPRVLKLIHEPEQSLRYLLQDVVEVNLWELSGQYLIPSLDWGADALPAPPATTNSAWITPIRLNSH